MLCLVGPRWMFMVCECGLGRVLRIVVLRFESFGMGQEGIPQGLKPCIAARLRGPRLKPWLT